MISRIWRGWTQPENADKYETLLREEIFPGIAAKNVDGYREIRLFRRSAGDGTVEFTTVMWFDSWEAVKRFAGDDYDAAHVPAKAREALDRFDERSTHYEVRQRLTY